MGSVPRSERSQRSDRRPLGRGMPCRLRVALRLLSRDDDLVPVDPRYAFPWHAAAASSRRQAFDKAWGATHQRDDPAAVAMHLMDSAETGATARHDLLVAQVGKPHHIAHQRGIHLRMRSSTWWSPSFSAAHFRCTALRIFSISATGTRAMRVPAIFPTNQNIQLGILPL